MTRKKVEKWEKNHISKKSGKPLFFYYIISERKHIPHFEARKKYGLPPTFFFKEPRQFGHFSILDYTLTGIFELRNSKNLTQNGSVLIQKQT